MIDVLGEKEMEAMAVNPQPDLILSVLYLEFHFSKMFLLLEKKKVENHFIKSFVHLTPLINLGWLSLYFTM